jgi:hypothetical protein
MEYAQTPQRMVIPVGPPENDDLDPNKRWDLTRDFAMGYIPKTLIADVKLYKQVTPLLSSHLTDYLGPGEYSPHLHLVGTTFLPH